MRARDYLAEYTKIDWIINSRLEQIEHLKSIAQGCTALIDGDRVQSSTVGQKLENAVVKYADLERELMWEIEEAQALKKEIIQTIERLPHKEYEVLYMLYIKGMMLKGVELELKRSHSYVTMTHKRALKHLQEILDGGTQCEE